MNDRDIQAIGIEMVVGGLPYAFVLRVLDLARESDGVADLIHLWAEAPDADERREVEADLQGMIEDREPAGEPLAVVSVDSGDQLLDERRRRKDHLRRLVEEHGGVSEVARRAEMPQPSLSRLLNSMSEPRPATMKRLAEAMRLSVSALSTDPPTPPSVVIGSPAGGLGTIRSAERRLRRLERHLGRTTDRTEAA
jgi:DNA-binding phage protein